MRICSHTESLAIIFLLYSINLYLCIQLFQIFSIRIINGCDKIEKKYTDLLFECSHWRVEIKDESLRNELQSVENYIRNLPPVFSAAGFFQLNQGLYSSICSALVTYFIVIIQFSQANVKNNNTNSTHPLLENNMN